MCDSNTPIKRCSACGEGKPATRAFYSPHSDYKDGLQSMCKACRNARYYTKRPPKHPPAPEGHKRCSRCGEYKPATAEHFNPTPKTVLGVKSRCKLCEQEESRARYALKKHWETPVAPEGATKCCTRCGVEKPASLEAFVRHKTGRYGMSAWCRDCTAKHSKAKRVTAPRVFGAQVGVKACGKCGEALAAQAFPLNSHSADGLGGWCKTCHEAAAKSWRLRNPETVKATQQRRRARVRQAEGKHTAQDLLRQFRQQGGRCYWCRSLLEVDGRRIYHADHLIPLARGGTNGPENIVCACGDCNLSKGAKLPHEWTNRLL